MMATIGLYVSLEIHHIFRRSQANDYRREMFLGMFLEYTQGDPVPQVKDSTQDKVEYHNFKLDHNRIALLMLGRNVIPIVGNIPYNNTHGCTCREMGGLPDTQPQVLTQKLTTDLDGWYLPILNFAATMDWLQIKLYIWLLVNSRKMIKTPILRYTFLHLCFLYFSN